MTTALQPYTRTPHNAPARWHLGALATILGDTDGTGGAFALVEQLMPSGFEVPYHVHHAEDEAFYVLDGEVTLVVDGETVVAGPGTFAFGPRDIPHGYRVTSPGTSRMLLLAAPAGFDQFVLEASVSAGERTIPTESQPPDIEELAVICARYGLEILGPLPQI